jgi:hypothetical protein
MAADRPDSLISTVKAIGEFTLMVFGIIGIAVEVFHDQGLLKQLLNKLMNEAFSSSMATIVIGIAVIILAKIWYEKVFEKAENANALGNFLMKAVMILGAYVLYHFISTGSLKI